MTTERAGVEVGGDSREAVRELEQLKDKAVQVSRSLGSMAKEAALTGLAVVGLDNVVAVLQRTVEFASESLGAFIERNRGASQSARVAATAMDTLKTQLGAAALGGGNAQLIFGELSRALSQMSLAVNENGEAIQEFTRQGLADLVDGLSELLLVSFDVVEQIESLYRSLEKVDTVVRASVLRPFTELMESTGLAAEGTAIPLGEVGNRLADIDARAQNAAQRNEGFRQSLEEVARAGRHAAVAMRENSGSIDGIVDSVNEAIERYAVLSALFGNSSQAPPPPPPPPRAQTLAPEEVEYEVEDLIRVFRESWQEFTATTVEGYKERGTAAAEAQAEVAQQLALKEEEQAAAAQARAQANADKLLRIEEEALERRKAIAGETAGLTASLVGELAAGEEKALDVIKRFLGQELMAKGQALVIEGGATLAFSPVGAIKLAAGLGMVAAGARMARTGGGGSGTAVESGAAPIPAATTPAPSTTMTQQVSFGIVGDPRAAAALVADSTRTAMREGFRGAA